MVAVSYQLQVPLPKVYVQLSGLKVLSYTMLQNIVSNSIHDKTKQTFSEDLKSQGGDNSNLHH